MLVQHFIRGFKDQISGGIVVFEPKTLLEALNKVFLVERSVVTGMGRLIIETTREPHNPGKINSPKEVKSSKIGKGSTLAMKDTPMTSST